MWLPSAAREFASRVGIQWTLPCGIWRALLCKSMQNLYAHVENPTPRLPYHWLDAKKSSIHQVDPQRQHLAAQVAGELKTVTNPIHLLKLGCTASIERGMGKKLSALCVFHQGFHCIFPKWLQASYWCERLLYFKVIKFCFIGSVCVGGGGMSDMYWAIFHHVTCFSENVCIWTHNLSL